MRREQAKHIFNLEARTTTMGLQPHPSISGYLAETQSHATNNRAAKRVRLWFGSFNREKNPSTFLETESAVGKQETHVNNDNAPLMCVSLHLMLLDGRAHCALTHKKIPPSFNLLIRSQPLIHPGTWSTFIYIFICVFSLFALSRVTPQFVCVSLGLPRRCFLWLTGGILLLFALSHCVD